MQVAQEFLNAEEADGFVTGGGGRRERLKVVGRRRERWIFEVLVEF